jgi:nitrite reductase (NO-forming)
MRRTEPEGAEPAVEYVCMTSTGTAAPPLTHPAQDRARRSGLRIALLALGASVFIVAPTALFSLQREAQSVENGPAVTFAVSAGNLRFEPAEIHVPRGANVRIDFTNDDPTGSPHDFQTFGQRRDTRTTAWPGERNPTVFKASDTPGRYVFICTLRGHAAAGMVGTIVVE